MEEPIAFVYDPFLMTAYSYLGFERNFQKNLDTNSGIPFFEGGWGEGVDFQQDFQLQSNLLQNS